MTISKELEIYKIFSNKMCQEKVMFISKVCYICGKHSNVRGQLTMSWFYNDGLSLNLVKD